MDEGDIGFNDGGDRNDQFHQNEAISAVVEEGFLGEEEEDDYEDLYNDVNIGEGILQSFGRNEEDLGLKNDEEERKIESASESPAVSIPGVEDVEVGDGGGGGGKEAKFEKDDDVLEGVPKVPARLDGLQNLGFRGNELASKGSGSGSIVGEVKVEMDQPSIKIGELEGPIVNSCTPSQGIGLQTQVVGVGNVGNEGFVRQGGGEGGNGNGVGGHMSSTGGGSGGGGATLFVGDLHWWTTDAQLEGELCKYGAVKELRFFDEKASGKSKGYCHVEFYDPTVATACKEGMNGHVFNGRPCVVTHASPYSVRRMGEGQVNKNQQMAQPALAPQGRREVNDATGGNGGISITAGGNYQGGDGGRNYQGGRDGGRYYHGGRDGGRNFGRGNWGRGSPQGMGYRGQVGPVRNRMGGMGGRGIIGNGVSGFGQGLAAGPQLLHPQTMMGQGLDPTYGIPMGRMGGYGGFPSAPAPSFSGILSPFPTVGGVGLPGVAPHVNPAFLGRGMPMNGMGVMPTTGVEGHSMGMWPDPNVAGWGSEEHTGRAGESSYGDDAASDQQYGEVNHERGGWPGAVKEKDRTSERDWSGASDRRYRDDREAGSDRGILREKDVDHDDWSERRHRDDREMGREQKRDRDRDRDQDRDRDREQDRDRNRYREDRDHHRYRDRESEHDDEWDRERLSRTHSKSRPSQEEDQYSRSRDAEYGKRRRRSSE